MTRPTSTPTRPDSPTRASLESRLAELEFERQQLIRQKRRTLLVAGVAVSLLVHLSILLYLDSIRRGGVPGSQMQSVSFDVSVMTEEDLTEMEQMELQTDSPSPTLELSDLPESADSLEQDITPPAAELELGETGSVSTLGGGATSDGSGPNDGDGLSLGGGGASTSFMGVSASGTRFLFIVDKSGSMTDQGKIRTAMSELVRSIEALPDYAYFYVILFESNYQEPPWQEDWQRARISEVSRLENWVSGMVARGGTQPATAFEVAFALERRPDVIFFLTDGQIPEDTADRVRDLNRRGKRVSVNTIAFGDARSQDLLKRIASDSGGVYRFVPVGNRN